MLANYRKSFGHFRMLSDLHSVRVNGELVVEGTGTAENCTREFHEIVTNEEFPANYF
jgi:hypothetical protein